MRLFESAARLILRFKSVRKTQLVTQPVQTVCFFSNTALGDTIFNTPVFRVFRQNFPHVRTVALLNPSTAPLFKTDPNIDEILLYNGKKGGFLRALFALKKVKPDVIFILHSNEPEATPLAVLSGAKYVFKLPNAGNKFSAFHSNAPEPYGDERYVVLNRLEQLKFVGIESRDTRLNLYLRDEDFTRVDEMLKSRGARKFIGFQMGASTVSRQWFLQRWQELAEIMLRHDISLVVVGYPRNQSGEPTQQTEFVVDFVRRLGQLDIDAEIAYQDESLTSVQAEQRLAGKIVVAHNASFDMGVLKASLLANRLQAPDFRTCCTVRIARKVWPGLDDHKLNTVGAHLNINFRHHRALDDARTCAAIPLFAGMETGTDDIEELAQKIGVRIGHFGV